MPYSMSRKQINADNDKTDTEPAPTAQHFAEQIPSSEGVNDVANRQHGISDADRDAGQRQNPDPVSYTHLDVYKRQG